MSLAQLSPSLFEFTNHFIKKLSECFSVLFILEPKGVEVKAQRSPVSVVMTPEVFHEHFIELCLREVRGAGVHHGAAELLHGDLVERHLPDPREGARRTSSVTCTCKS